MKTFFLLGFALIVGTLNAQQVKKEWASDWKVFTSRYTYDEGEASTVVKTGNNYINAVVVDNFGIPWIAAGNRLMQYRDKKLVPLGRLPFGPGASITALACDSKNNLWVGSSKGLAVFDGKDWKPMPAGTDVQPIGNVNEIIIDKEDRVWISGWNTSALNQVGAGLSVYNGKVWTNYNKRDGELPRKFVEDLALDGKGNIWVSMGFNDNGVGRFDGKDWTIYTTDNSELPSNTVRDIVVDKDGTIIFGTPKGLARFDGSKWEIQDLRTFFNNKFLDFFVKQNDIDILSMAIDYQGVLWVGTRGRGIFRVHGNSKIVFNAKNSPLTSDYVRDIYIDADDNKWFITGFSNQNWKDVFTINDEVPEAQRYQGVVMYGEPNYSKYSDWKIYNRYTIPVKNALSNALLEDKDGKVYAATSRGLCKIDPQTMDFEKQEGEGTGLIFQKMAFAPNGDWWGATINGAKIFSIKDGKWQLYDKKNNPIDAKKYLDVAPTKDGIWTADYKNIVFFDGKTTKKYGKKEGVPGGMARSIIVDKSGKVWAGTMKGVGMYDGNKWTTYNKKETGLTGNEVWSLAEGKNGEIIVGTRRGLDIFDGEKWEHIRKFGKMTYSVTVTAITTDDKGRIWVGTYAHGIFMYDGTNWEHYNGENSGMYLRQVNDLMVKDNELWIAASKGSAVGTGGAAAMAAATADTESEAYKVTREINKKIQSFEPSGAIIRHELN